MSYQVIIPNFGESITSANVAEWFVATGDYVEKGQRLASLETDKVSNDVEAEVSGTIKIIIDDGEVEIGALIAEIDESGEGSSPTVAATPTPESATPAPPESAGEPIELTVPSFGDSINTASVGAWNFATGDAVNKGDVLVILESDKVSSELEAPESGTLTVTIEEGEEVDIGAVIGVLQPGVGAPVAAAPVATPKEDDAPEIASKPDLSQSTAPARTPAASAPLSEGRTTRKKMTMLRRKISQHLVNAQHTAAILTTFNEVDMTAIMELRKCVQETFVAKHGIKLGFMSFFVKAVVQALKDVPQINGRIDGTDIIQNHYYDMGVAIGTEKGLVVPVLRDPDQMGFAEIEQAIKNYAIKAQDGKIEMTDLQGGVFTISNGGTYGSLLSTPILNPPQSGILGMHTIQQRPVAIDGKVEIRPMMYLAMSYDHRLVDGKEAVTFLIRIKENLENPTRLMLEL